MQLSLAYPGTSPTYWLEAPDELLVTALDELDRRANRAQQQQRKGGRRGKS